MRNRKALRTKAELAALWQETPTADSRTIVTNFRAKFGAIPGFELHEIVEYGLMVLSGRMAGRRLIPKDDIGFLAAIEEDPDRARIRNTVVLEVEDDCRRFPMKFEVDKITPSLLGKWKARPMPRKSTTPLDQAEVIMRDIEKMRRLGLNGDNYVDFLRKR